MTSFIKSAKSVHDVESDLAYVEIVYERYVKGQDIRKTVVGD
jgi:hypothetical protein